MPDIEFINSPKTEDERLKFTRRVIEQGFYKRQGFVVVPKITSRVKSNIQVVYPKVFEYKPVEVKQFATQWRAIERDFWNVMDDTFKNISSSHGRIEVRVTRYGTTASGAVLRDHKSNRVVYYLRNDAGIASLAGMIINKVLFAERKNLGISWSKREALMDFIMTRPKMNMIFPGFRPVFGELIRVPAILRQESDEYIRSLGIEEKKPDFELLGKKIYVKGKEMGKELTKMEKKVLKLLIEKIGDLVTYDEFADVIWGQGEFKTYWAINKLVGRMRPKLEKLGVTMKIEPVRGQGYILK